MARSLIQSKIAKELRGSEKLHDDQLDPGHMRLYSFYKPSLQAGLYSIEVKQKIQAFRDNQIEPPLPVFNRENPSSTDILGQGFRVIAPQFSLDPNLINTYYPPTGHQDEGRILPHIVFNDPHVPWFREAGRSPWMLGPVDTGAAHSDETSSHSGHNLMPWIAVLVFEQNDLLVPPEDAKLLQLDGMNSYNPLKLPANGAFAMTVGEYLSKIQSRVRYEAGFDDAPEDFAKLHGTPGNPGGSPEVMSAIFPKKSQVEEIFQAGTADLAPLKAHKLLAHVRRINTIGFPDAGVEEEGYYSVVISSMSGNQLEVLPSTHVVHVVSLEHLDSTLNHASFSSTEHSDRIGLVSLFSWTYTCIPDSISFAETMEALGAAAQPLKPPKELLEALHRRAIDQTQILDRHGQLPDQHGSLAAVQPSPSTSATGSTPAPVPNPATPDPTAAPKSAKAVSEGGTTVSTATTGSDALSNGTTDKIKPPVAAALYARLNAGYTIARWRTPTGEESIAFNHGPLVPMRTQEVPLSQFSGNKTRPWPALSMTGKDYEVFDESVGIMDATYSSAWSLGKLMAISDSVFNSAIMRFRSSIWNEASSATRKDLNGTPSKSGVIQGSLSAVSGAHAITGDNFSGPVSRINKPASPAVTTSMDDEKAVPILRGNIAEAVTSYASVGSDKNAPLYNGFDGKPGNNSDWEVILNWIHNVMYMATIPAHVLFPEPSHLHSTNPHPTPPDQPSYHPEALRFFHIDHAWIDCFLDGALSCANHLEPEYDFTRLRMKAVFNDYLRHAIGNTGKTPPVPRYGFVIRSGVVKSTPDLRLKVTCWTRGKVEDPDKPGTFKDGWVEDPKRDPLVQHTRMDEFTIFSLVDCLPEEIYMIKFSQPPHQQRFALVYNVRDENSTERTARVIVKRLYTDKDQAPPHDPHDAAVLSEDDKYKWNSLPSNEEISSHTDFYTVASRCIKPQKLADEANKRILQWANDPIYQRKPPYTDTVPNSCILGLELNDPAFELEITGTKPDPDAKFPDWTRQIWRGPTDPPAPTEGSSTTGGETAKTGTSTTPSTTIAVKPHDPAMAHDLPSKAMLNGGKAVPLSVPITEQHLAPTTLVDPFVDSMKPQFELLVHPDYRPPPPRPFRLAKQPYATSTHSPLDYLPTKTRGFYDLIFAVRRRGKIDTNPRLNLQALVIEIPVSEASGGKDSDGHIREPLLDGGDYSGAGVSMCSNQRFVPTLFSGVASRIGSKKWDQRPILGIKLVPKSGLETGTMALVADDKAMEASVRLGDANVVPIVDKKTTALVARLDPKTKKPFNDKPNMGMCMIRLTEIYDNRVNEWSWCAALKLDDGDKDPQGNVI